MKNKQRYTIWWDAHNSIILKYHGNKPTDDEHIFDTLIGAKYAMLSSIDANLKAWEEAKTRVNKLKSKDVKE